PEFNHYRCGGRSDFAARHRDGLARDGAGAFAAEPEHGVGHFRWRYEPSLRIVLRQFSHRLLAATAGLLDDVVDRAFQQIGFGETGTYGIDGNTALRRLQRQRTHETNHRMLGGAIGADIGVALETRRRCDGDD